MPSLEEKILKEVGVNVKQKEKDNSIYVSYLETPEYILEQIKIATHASHQIHATDTEYICYEKETGSISHLSEFRYGNLEELTYKPVVDDLVKKGAIQLPTGVEEYGDTATLITEIKEFLDKYIELPKLYDEFLPYLVLFYWVYEQFPFVPYVQFVGRTGTGKTTAMEVFGSICYKPIDASGSITMSPIFRTANVWRGTLLLDEFNGTGDNYQEMVSFLKSGVSNRAILRTEGDKEREVKAYIIKSPKIFTSEAPISDAGLQSRTIVIKMEKNTRRLPLYRLKHYDEEACHLRNKLLLWRFRNLNKIDLSAIEFGFDELKELDKRVQQVITPIYYFSDESAKQSVLSLAKNQQEETLRERREAIDGQIFSLINEAYPMEISVKHITETINGDMGAQRQYSEKRIANTIRKVLGFDIQREGHEKNSMVKVDKEHLENLKTYYGIVTPDASVYSDASVAVEAEEIETATHWQQIQEDYNK